MKNLCDITILLDQSGSMRAIKEGTIAGINNFIAEQRALPGDVEFSLYTFDDPETAMWSLESFPKQVFSQVNNPVFTGYDFKPRGNTALFDAACILIDNLGTRLSGIKEEDRPNKIVFMIVTDGLDNRSRRSRYELKKRIDHQTQKYSWNFQYLGTNQDALLEGASFGVEAANTTGFEYTSGGVRKGLLRASSNVGAYRASV